MLKRKNKNVEVFPYLPGMQQADLVSALLTVDMAARFFDELAVDKRFSGQERRQATYKAEDMRRVMSDLTEIRDLLRETAFEVAVRYGYDE